eukprot:COSAG02_NODE_6157_length_3759_cov_4.278142_3_plen_77_part_00
MIPVPATLWKGDTEFSWFQYEQSPHGSRCPSAGTITCLIHLPPFCNQVRAGCAVFCDTIIDTNSEICDVVTDCRHP